MKIISTFQHCLLLIILLSASAVFAQDKSKNEKYGREFCSDNWTNGDKISAKDLRESTIAAPDFLRVDAGQNGGVDVRGENRKDVLVRACVQAWGSSAEEANSIAKGIRVETNSTVRAESSGANNNWSVSYRILVPRSMNLDLKAHNGGITINSVEGSLYFETQNGGVNLSNLAGEVRGKTQNGGLSVKLSGTNWRGSGLDVETKNGGVRLSMPEVYAARLETGTVNGGFKSDIAGISLPDDDTNKWNRKKHITTDLNGGGAPVRVVTTNGGVRIDSSK